MGREHWTMPAFAQDVQAVVEKLRLEDVVLVGHSMGGAVMVEAALAMPDRVRGLVGVDNFQRLSFGLNPDQIDGWLASFANDFPGSVEPWVRSMFPDGADPELVDRVAADMASAPPEVGIGALRETLLWYTDRTTEALGNLRVPLTCINSDKTPTDQEGLSRVVSAYRLHLMPGRGHFLMLEDPTTFNSLLGQTVAAFEPADGSRR
jgi:pimeloyl-ACP methyl ester carboxylesterase